MRVVAVLVLLLLAGCVRPAASLDEGPVDVAREPDAYDDGYLPAGSLDVVALFADRTPLAGVNVTVGNASRLTDATGAARFDHVFLGEHTLVASKTAHRTAQQQLTIVEGRNVAEIILAAEDGGQHAHAVGFNAHTDVYAFQGRFDCSATYVIITGDCLILVENVTKTAGAPDPVSGATAETNVIDFPLDVNWSSLVVEMTWNETDLPTTDGMTLALEPAEAPIDGHAAKYARADGYAPLRIELAPGVKHATATGDDMPEPAGGEVIRARAFLRGHGHHPGGTDFLGVGATQDFAFTLYVSIFYGEPAPSGYTATA